MEANPHADKIKKTEVSVVVACYNPVLEKLLMTLRSIIFQENVTVEIIVVDDGSKDQSLYKRLPEFFEDHSFTNYTFVLHEINSGTVHNMLDGVKAAHGEFIKLISPGDCLFKENTLRHWVDYMRDAKIPVSFGDAILYNLKGGKLEQITDKRHPLYQRVYNSRASSNVLASHYIIGSDNCLGAKLLSERVTTERYLFEIAPYCKYTEDVIYRLMLADGLRIGHFQENAVWYESGTGISAENNGKWAHIIESDFLACDKLILQRQYSEASQRRLQKYLACHGSINKARLAVHFPEKVLYSLQKSLPCNKTPITDDIYFFMKIIAK